MDANGWVPAEDLSVGTVVRGLDHDWEVTGHEIVAEPTVVYNLTVAEAHTYFVGDAGVAGAVWVHNECHYPSWRKRVDEVLTSDPEAANRIRKVLGKPPGHLLQPSDFTELFNRSRNEIVPGTPGVVTEANSTTLRRAMRDAGISELDNAQAHHLFPGAVVRDHPLTQITGFVSDHPSNGKFVRSKYAADPGQVWHTGSHEAYSEVVTERLSQIMQKHGIDPDNFLTWTDEAMEGARRDMRRLQNQLRRVLDRGRVPLNFKTPGTGNVKEKLLPLWDRSIIRFD